MSLKRLALIKLFLIFFFRLPVCNVHPMTFVVSPTVTLTGCRILNFFLFYLNSFVGQILLTCFPYLFTALTFHV